MRPPTQPGSRASDTQSSSVVPLNPTGSTPQTAGPLDELPTILNPPPGSPSSAASGFELAAGSQLGHFEIVAPLGAGGMASVYQARDLTLGRDVALKILPPELARDPDAVSRFRQEARAAAQLNHEYIARVFYIGEDRGLHFIAFEFVIGETLREAIDRLGTIPPADCVRHLLCIASGLRHASEQGVVHRDIKPSNILLTPDGRAKLIDMGLARSRHLNAVNGGVTQSGTTLGTFDYISPEQAIDPRSVDVRSDIYSLGCTCYHALTGRPPVPEGNAARKLSAHQSEPPVDPRLLNPELPDELAGVLERMMAKNPAHRFQTAAELTDEVTRVARLLGVPVDGTDLYPVVPSERTAESRPGSGVGGFALLVGGSALLVALVVVYGVWSNTAYPPPPPWADAPPRPPVAAVEPIPADGPPPAPRSPAATATVADTGELIRAVEGGVTRVNLTPGVVYDLTAANGLVVTGKAVEWVCPADPRPAVVRVPVAAGGTLRRPAALAFDGCQSVRLSGIRFEVRAGEPLPGQASLLFSDVGRVELSEAVFETAGSTGSPDLVGLRFRRVGEVTARHCYFGVRDRTGLELHQVPSAAFTECGFDTGETAIRVTSEPAFTARTQVELTHTTFRFWGAASAVSVDQNTACDLTAGWNVFAASAADSSTLMVTRPDRKPAVVRGADSADYTFTTPEGRPNAVYLVTPPATVVGAAVDDLPASPWATGDGSGEGPAWAGLALNTKLRPLRVSAAGEGILGVRRLPTERQWLYPIWPLPALDSAGVKVWYPDATPAELAQLPANVYPELAQAVAALKGKDVLEIRGSGRIPVRTAVVLSDPKRTVVVRAESGSRPVLVPANDGRKDTAIFRLEAGDLTLDGLGFLLQPNGSDGTTAVVNVSGGRRCELRNCVVSLDEEADERAAAVSVSDVSDQMRSDTTVRPTLSVENCLVRGRGRLIRAGTGVPMDVSVTNCGLAATGPLFEFGSPSSPPPFGSWVSLQLSQLTVVAGGPLIDVRGSRRAVDDKPLVVPVDVRAEGCLFLPLESSAPPLVSLSGCDPFGGDRCLLWTTGPVGNAYSGWNTYAELSTEFGLSDPKRLDASDWRKWTAEREAAFGRASLAKPPVAKSLLAVQPADLELVLSPFPSTVGVRTSLLPAAPKDATR